MKVNIKSKTPVLILSLAGELTLNNRQTVGEELNSLLPEGKDVVIDGSSLDYVDSSGLGLFLEINNQLKQKGFNSLVFLNLTPVVKKSLEVTHLVQIMPIYISEQEAVQGFTQSWQWRIPSNLAYVKSVSNKILESLSRLKLDNYFLTEIRLCIEEAVINAVKHGNKLKSQRLVGIGYKLEDHQLEISVSDEGEGFNTKVRGKGLALISNFMDEVKFNQKGNSISMFKKV